MLSSKFSINRHLLTRLNQLHYNQLKSFSSLNKNDDIIKTPLSQQPNRSAYDLDEEVNPVVYSKSKDKDYKASDNYRIDTSHFPPSQWCVIFLSTVLFLCYWAFLREENDMDERLKEPFGGNEVIYKKLLESHLNRPVGKSSKEEIEKKIKELEAKIEAKKAKLEA